MRVFLDAYFDNNFGDDLFVNILLNRYPKVQFYVFRSNLVPEVLVRAMRYNNLTILPGDCELQTSFPFDAYIMIGGDVLPDGVNYTQRLQGMRQVKAGGGFVAMLGFNLYESYGEQTRTDLQEMAGLADVIVPRDRASAERFRMLVPEAVVTESTDMAFARNYASCARSENTILGMAPRRRLYSTEEEYKNYCRSMAAIADLWLNRHEGGIVRFFAFSTGEYDDRVTCEQIQDFMQRKKEIEVVAYTDDLDAFLQELSMCSVMLTTRFHGLVFSLIYGIPFVPVIYEVKLSQLLDEVGYEGSRLPYGTEISAVMLEQSVKELHQKRIDPEKLNLYRKKAVHFFEGLDDFIKLDRTEPGKLLLQGKNHFGCAIGELEPMKRENEFLKQQVKELSDWVNVLQKERQEYEQQSRELMECMERQRREYEQQNQELIEIKERQWKQLQQTTEDYAALDAVKTAQEKQLQEISDAYKALHEKCEKIAKWIPFANFVINNGK